jgi:hypothetical protein
MKKMQFFKRLHFMVTFAKVTALQKENNGFEIFFLQQKISLNYFTINFGYAE